MRDRKWLGALEELRGGREARLGRKVASRTMISDTRRPPRIARARVVMGKVIL